MGAGIGPRPPRRLALPVDALSVLFVRQGRPSSIPFLLALAVTGVAAACSGGKKGETHPTVFDLRERQCVVPPETKTTDDIKGELTFVTVVPCATPHTQEVFALVAYPGTIDLYPGDKVLSTFAGGACLDRYEAYVGVAYADSKLFYTFLYPSARSWNDRKPLKDRMIVCLITTTGNTLTASVEHSGM